MRGRACAALAFPGTGRGISELLCEAVDQLPEKINKALVMRDAFLVEIVLETRKFLHPGINHCHAEVKGKEFHAPILEREPKPNVGQALVAVVDPAEGLLVIPVHQWQLFAENALCVLYTEELTHRTPHEPLRVLGDVHGALNRDPGPSNWMTLKKQT